ncbi:hypothetical protein NKDENANG_03704 [Candidatus Entotheonellaceae bacterium PAL068K]
MQPATAVTRTDTQTTWTEVNWWQVMKSVRQLRQRIYTASRQGNHRKARSLQRLMLRSYSNRLLAVRRVTQINKGRVSAGVDKVVVKTPEARTKFGKGNKPIPALESKTGTTSLYPKAEWQTTTIGHPNRA